MPACRVFLATQIFRCTSGNRIGGRVIAGCREDHADDLYFRSGLTRKKKPKPIDPNQLDLFRGDGPDQSGCERQDPDNPDIVLTEEGDGTRFGSGAEKEAE